MDTPIIPQKTCTKCGLEFPATLEFFMAHKGGLYSQCHDCRRLSKRESHVRNREHNNERTAKWADENRDYKREMDRAYYVEHSEVIKERVKQWRIDNPNSRKQAYWENPSMYRAYSRKHYAKNPEPYKANAKAWRSKNRERHNELNREWDKSHPESARRKSAKRRAIKRQAITRWTTTDERHALEYFDYKCAICGKSIGLWSMLVFDHWIPMAGGGNNTPDNLVPICHSKKDGQGTCNESKADRNPADWLTERYGKRKAKTILARIQAYFDSLKT